MHLWTHALLGWLVAETVPTLERRDRLLVFLAAAAPDVDAVSALGGAEVYQAWHHVLLHNGLSGVVFAGAAVLVAKRRALVGVLALVAFHLHLLCDLLGSAGPDGSVWPIPYLAPFDMTEFLFAHQWGLSSWQNMVVTACAVLACIHLGARRGRTVVEVFSRRADAAVVEVFQRRWPWGSVVETEPDS